MEITVTQFKAKCLGIVEQVEREGCRVVISRHGKPAAELIPLEGTSGAGAIFGRSAETTEVLEDLFSTGEDWDAEQ